MCALACCWSLFTVNSTAIAQLPTIKTTKTLNSATCTAVWMAICMCVCMCVWESESANARSFCECLWEMPLCFCYDLLWTWLCVCAYCAQALLLFCCLQFFCYCSFGWQHLGPISNAQRCHLTHLHWTKVQPYHSPQQSAAVSCYTVAALLVLLLLLLFRTSGTRSRPARRQRRGSERTRGCSFSGAAS